MNPFEALTPSTQIFADARLNERFFCAIEILAQLVMSMPRSVSLTNLAQHTGKTVRQLRPVLTLLAKEGLAGKDGKEKDAWHCRDCNGIITLADVYQCIARAHDAAQAARVHEGGALDHTANVNRTSVELLMMQVKMNVNRVVLEQLEQFDLVRLRGLARQSTLPRALHLRGYIAEPH